MELLAIGDASTASFKGLQILTLDPGVAGRAQRAVELVVMRRAIRFVIEDVEVRRLEGNAAVAAHKT